MTFLGVVNGTKIGKFDERLAWIWPLLDTSNGQWSAFGAPQDEFPPRGYIFWPRAPQNAVKGALFQVKAKPLDVPKENGDEFVVGDARPAFEVVDLRWIGDAEQVRIALTQGIQLSGVPPQRTLLWCAGDRVVGPVSLTTGTNRETSLEKNDRARIQYFQLPQSKIREFEYEGAVRYIIAKPSLGQPDGHFDWDDDKPVIRRGLEYAVERAKTMRGSLDFSRQMIDDSVDELTKNGSIQDLRLKQYRLQRSLSLANELKGVGEVADELIATLLQHPVVLKEVEQVKLQERDKARGDMELALASERNELAQLKETRASAASGLQKVQEQLADSEASFEEQTRGHSPLGWGTSNGVVLDLSPLNRVVIDPKSRTARIEAGVLGGEVIRQAGRYGLAPVLGQCPGVGAAGVTLAGGLGWLSGLYGASCDNVLALQLVTADGRVVSVDGTRDPDLFWALRGAGANSESLPASNAVSIPFRPSRPETFFTKRQTLDP